MSTTVAVLHPGAMGVAVANALVSNGHRTLWCPTGRSDATAARAAGVGLEAMDLPDLLSEADVVLSVCPPSEALAVAEEVVVAGFDGTYVDGNAVSPNRAREIEALFDPARVDFVDGGIIGLPPEKAGSTRLYLSGDSNVAVAELFSGTVLGAHAIEGGIGAASALKMCYASWTKGSAALLLSIRAVAKAEGAELDLVNEWDLSQVGLADRSEGMAAGAAPKGWRFAGEMHEIADTFAGAGLPDGFFRSAAEVYEMMAPVKDQFDPPVTVADVAQLLTGQSPQADSGA